MFKKVLNSSIIVILYFCCFSFSQINAIKIVTTQTKIDESKMINVWEMFIFFGKLYDSKIPESYKYIDVKMKWFKKWSELYNNIQKLIYVGILKNYNISIKENNNINAYSFYRFAELNYNIDLIKLSNIKELKNRKAIYKDFLIIQKNIEVKKTTFDIEAWYSQLKMKKEIFTDVYKTLWKNHYWKDDIDKVKMIEYATKWLADSIWDKHTVYFPPTENKDFNESLNWEYEGIWAYVDMEKPWEVKIISPISESPAERAWLKWWDIIIKVDNKEISEWNSLLEVVSWIKGELWSEVLLTIKRRGKTLKIKVIRWSIILKEVEAKKINPSTYYIQMKFFWPTVSSEFKKSLEILKTDKKIKKIIFDLRWNWGWYLWEVSIILWNFIARWQVTAQVQYYWNKKYYYSMQNNEIDFWKYKIILLQNWWTASASEIFIGTIKDYFPKSIIIWEQSYWKWSVQTVKSYKDGSSLKYTIAKWYTWKNAIWIDWIWITPDIIMEVESYWGAEKNDKQLQKAIHLR